MTQLQRIYEKYRDEFEKLERLARALYPGNPFQYEQALAQSVFGMYGRDGMIHHQAAVYENGEIVGFKDDPEIAPAERKKKIDAYWEQRDRLDALLKEDRRFHKIVKNKGYLMEDEEGLHAFYWMSHFAHKHKIYPLMDE